MYEFWNYFLKNCNLSKSDIVTANLKLPEQLLGKIHISKFLSVQQKQKVQNE